MDKENFGLQITDEDIEWVRTIMPDIELDECRIQILKNMNSVDIHACPGSGKTTILVAKLAILSRKWKWQNRGICVLSHTNVAREEIEERLGTLNVGKKLLSYPHFIGTFQAFLDTFIAMPFLRSCGCPVNIIDTDYVLERRWKSIRIKKCLEAHGKDKYVCDPLELPYKLDVKLGTGTATYKNVVKAVTESRRRGEFTFNEMELYAAKGIDSISTLPFELTTKEDRMRTCYMQACLAYVNFEGISNSDIRQIFGLGEKEKAKASRLLNSAVEGGYIKAMDPNTAPRYRKYIPYWA